MVLRENCCQAGRYKRNLFIPMLETLCVCVCEFVCVGVGMCVGVCVGVGVGASMCGCVQYEQNKTYLTR
jgi:hypothetical protein